MMSENTKLYNAVKVQKLEAKLQLVSEAVATDTASSIHVTQASHSFVHSYELL